MNYHLNIPVIPILAATLLMGIMLSCQHKKPNLLAEQFSGHWEVTSWKNNNIEFLAPSPSASFTMDFDFEEDTDGGNFTWNWVFSNGTSSFRTGTYEVNENSKKFSTIYTEDGGSIQTSRDYDLTLNGNILELSTEVSGTSIFLRAERK